MDAKLLSKYFTDLAIQGCDQGMQCTKYGDKRDGEAA